MDFNHLQKDYVDNEHNLNLEVRRVELARLAYELFVYIINLPSEIRQDTKKRHGIQTLVWEPNTRNLVIFPSESPSEAAKFFSIEKAVRANCFGHISSANSAKEESMKYPGALSARFDKRRIFVSVSGLKPEEDAAVSLLILAHIFDVTPLDVIENIKIKRGQLPEEFDDENHYLYALVRKDYDKFFRSARERFGHKIIVKRQR